jgi:Lrp/AsnC family leucine-responsive transcriptional regulator
LATDWQGSDLTGQAVAARVQQMEDRGMISGYTIRQHNVERHFILMFMENPDFVRFEAFLRADERVESASKVTGEGCYHLTFVSQEANDLEPFLNALLKYGKYKVSSVLRDIK